MCGYKDAEQIVTKGTQRTIKGNLGGGGSAWAIWLFSSSFCSLPQACARANRHLLDYVQSFGLSSLPGFPATEPAAFCLARAVLYGLCSVNSYRHVWKGLSSQMVSGASLTRELNCSNGCTGRGGRVRTLGVRHSGFRCNYVLS